MSTRREIRAWMVRNVDRFVDRTCDVVNATKMVEAWDQEIGTGEETLDSEHVAWEVAIEVAGLEEKRLDRAVGS